MSENQYHKRRGKSFTAIQITKENRAKIEQVFECKIETEGYGVDGDVDGYLENDGWCRHFYWTDWVFMTNGYVSVEDDEDFNEEYEAIK